MYMIQGRFSVRSISKYCHVAKSTVQDYKKRGPPSSRKFFGKSTADSYPASWPEERNLFIQKIEELLQHDTQFSDQKHKDERKIQYLEQEINQKDKSLETKNKKIEEDEEKIRQKDTQLNNIEQAWQKGEEKLNDIFVAQDREIKKWKDKYNEAVKLLDEKQTQPPESPHDVPIITESAPADKETDDSSIKIDNYLLATVGITVVQLIALYLNNSWKKPVALMPKRTPRRFMQQVTPSFDVGFGEGAGQIVPIPLVKEINTSGSPYTGTYDQNDTEYATNESPTFPTPQNTTIRSNSQDIKHGATLGTQTSGDPYTGASYFTSGDNNSSGYTVFTRQQNNAMQPDINNEVIIETNTLETQGAKVYYSSHAEITGSQFNITTLYQPCFYQAAWNYNPLPSKSYISDPWYIQLMEQLKKLEGHAFERYLKRFIEYLGYPVELTKQSYDMGADLIITLPYGQKVVIQAKRHKAHIGPEAVQAAYAAIKIYNANHAIVVTTSQLTTHASTIAEKLGVEYWDCDKLMQILHDHHYYHSPEWE